MRLAAGLCPDPLGSLSALPDPLAAIGAGVVLLLRGREGRRGERRRNRERREVEDKWEGRVRGRDCLLLI